MSNSYVPVLWNRQKRVYDRTMALLMGLYLLVFVLLQVIFFPEITAETLIIRATGTLAFLMLHIILCIGPLSRINPRFLPLLYNRRHLGVSMFLIALVHGVFNLIQFHSLGNTDPLISLFTANTHYGSLQDFPFQVLGFFALLILFLMAATSHDFWLKNLGPGFWKTLHMLVYVVYALLLMHVCLGVIQLEQSPVWMSIYGLGLVPVVGLHLWAGMLEKHSRRYPEEQAGDGFVLAFSLEEIKPDRARIMQVDGQDIAIFRYEGKLSAISNTCRHQHGPLGEGKVVDGCVTCPWHGYQYLPHNGQSPPPFTEKVETYDVKLVGDKVYVHPRPYPPGTERPPVQIPESLRTDDL